MPIISRRRSVGLSGPGVPVATHLAFTTPPGLSGVSPYTLSPQPVVAAQNGSNTTDTTYAGTVTITLNVLTGSPVLSGTRTKALVSGVADFSGNALVVTGAGTWTLTATLSPLTSATSSTGATTGAVTVYGSDAFTDVDNTIAHSHTPVAVGAGPAFSALVDLNGANSVLKILNNRLSVVGATAGLTYRIGWTAPSTPPSAQTLKGDLVFLTDEVQVIAVGSCCDVVGGHVGGYFLQWQGGTFSLIRWTDSFTSAQLGSNFSYAFAAGTVPFEITHDGAGGLSVKVNGSVVITATDATPLTGRLPACMIRMLSTLTLTTTTGIVLDNLVLQAP